MDKLVTKETAMLAKKVGFDKSCEYYYIESNKVIHYSYLIANKDHKEYAAPTKTELQAWLREKHHIHIMIGVDDLDWWWQLYDSSANGRLKRI